VPAASP